MSRVMSHLLHPTALDVFLRDHASQRPCHVRGAADRHVRWFDWRALDDVLNAAPAPHPALRLVSPQTGSMSPGTAAEAIAALRQGMGLVLEQADRYHAGLADLAEAVSAELDEPCRVNVYATGPSMAAFPLHADTHDVFVLHLAGRKRWRITGPSLPDPLFHPSLQPQTPPDDVTPTLQAMLAPGDTLYIPRGHWHDAIAVDGPSLHLTVAVFHTTGMDLIAALAEELYASPLWRAALPMAVGPAVRDAGQVSHADAVHLQALAASLAERMADPDLLTRLRARRLAQATPRRPFAVSAHMGGTRAARYRSQPATVRVERRDDGVVLHIAGRDLWLPPGVRDAVDVLLCGEPFDIDDVVQAADLDEDAVQRIVDDLVAEGILRPTD